MLLTGFLPKAPRWGGTPKDTERAARREGALPGKRATLRAIPVNSSLMDPNSSARETSEGTGPEAAVAAAGATAQRPRWGKGTEAPEEGRFLAGPHSRLTEAKRLWRI